MKVEIRLTNTYSFFENYDYYPTMLKKEIMTTASYIMPEARFSEAFRKGKWDGRQYLITSKGRFPTGILGIMVALLKRLNHTVSFKDERIVPAQSLNISWIGQELRDYQQTAVDKLISSTRGIVEIPTRTGKAQPLYSKVLTPKGWTTIGEIKVGDLVIGKDGKAKSVLAVYPQGIKEIFRIVFSDKSHTDCCAEHLWGVKTPDSFRKIRKQNNGDWEVKQLKDLGNLRWKQRRLYRIPTVAPVQFDVGSFTLNPYLLGVLLGDGCITRDITISNADEDILDKVRRVLPDDACMVKCAGKNVDYRIKRKDWKRGGQRLKSSVHEELINLQLMGKDSASKFIPSQYLYASVSARVLLLRGIMDTAGTVDRNGKVEIILKSKALLFGVSELIRSLGGRVTITEKQVKYNDEERLFYRAYINVPKSICPFSLPRKVERFVAGSFQNEPSRYIDEIFPIGKFEAKCITVEDDYYVTDDYIVTHNTWVSGKVIQELGLKTLYIVNGKESMYQTVDDLSGCIKGCSLAYFGDGRKDVGDVTVGLIQSFMRVKDQSIFDDIDLLIIDEIHKAGAKMLYNFTMKLDAFYRYGMSGTAFREDNRDLKIVATTGRIIHRETQEDMWDAGWIMRPEVVWVDPKATKLNRTIDYRMAYEIGIIDNVERNEQIRKLVEQHDGEQILISIENIPHGSILLETLKQFNPSFMYGDMPKSKRMELFKQFKEGSIRLMIATRLMNESVTLPDLSVLINAAGRKSGIELLQKFGRVQGKGNKDRVIIYDFVDSHSQHLFSHSVSRMRKLKKRGYEQRNLELFG